MPRRYTQREREVWHAHMTHVLIHRCAKRFCATKVALWNEVLTVSQRKEDPVESGNDSVK